MNLLVKLLMCLTIICITDCARIMIVPAHFTSASHPKSMLPIAEELAKQGHDVHFWKMEYIHKPVNSPFCKEDALMVESNQQWVLDIVKYENDTLSETVQWSKRYTNPLIMTLPWFMASIPCKTAIEEHYNELIDVANGNWDIIMFESFFSPCSWFIKKHAPPETITISISSSIWMETTVSVRASNRHIVTNPWLLSPLNYDMLQFSDRLGATIDHLKSEFIFTPMNSWMMYVRLGRDYWDYSTSRLEESAALALTGFPDIMDWPRARVPDAKSYVGGDNFCTETKTELEEEYRAFVEEPASKGTIIAAFGHHTSWRSAPPNVIESFVVALNNLSDYRIIWQYSHGPDVKMLDHVKIVTWFPQKQLLLHPKTKLFVSHMGLKSVSEAVCAGVPVGAMPLFAEQPRNSANLKFLGMALPIDKHTVTPSELINTAMTLLTDPTFKQNAVKWSTYMRDGYITSPQKESAFMIKILSKRYKNIEKFIYTRGRTMGYFTYFSVDVIVVFIGAIIVMLSGATLIALRLRKMIINVFNIIIN